MGFELCVRAETNGQQAGTLIADDTTTQLQTAKGIQYISHTAASTRYSTWRTNPPIWGLGIYENMEIRMEGALSSHGNGALCCGWRSV